MSYVGIDLGGTQLRVTLANGRGDLGPTLRWPTEASGGPDHVISRIVAAVRDVVGQGGLRPGQVRALGIGMPGPLDPRAGVVFEAANLPGWKDVPLTRILSRRTGIKSHLQHDAHAAAFAEFRRGAAKGASTFVYVTVSTGIGAGMMIEGRLYNGAGGVAGEVGHIVVMPGGPLCRCGNHGCLEALASGTAIARSAREALQAGSESLLRRVPPPGPTARDVDAAARASDTLARRLLADAGRALGVGLGTLINLLNPELIVLGGSVMKSGRSLIGPMRESMVASSWAANRRALRIVPPRLAQDVGLIGAVEWARFSAKR